jgi:putative hydrolase of the HAD superfamily
VRGERRRYDRTGSLGKDGLVTDLTDGMSAVVFDFYGTLTPVSPGEVWASNAARLAAIFGVPPADLLRVLDDSFPERISGAFGDVRQTMQTIGERLGVPVTDQQLADASATRREVQELPDAWPRLPLAPLVDAPVFSCVERTRKPDARLFHAVADRLPADPTACLYVGDGGGRELTGASGVGMRAVLLAGSDWHEHRDHRTEADWAGPRITSLLELVA